MRIVGSRVFDDADNSLVSADISIDDGMISNVDFSHSAYGSPLHEGEHVIDATGLTILPGFIDCHTHLTASAGTDLETQVRRDSVVMAAVRVINAARTHLRNGTTTVRDLGARNTVPVEISQLIRTGDVVGADIQAAGNLITMTGGHGHFLGCEADGVDELRKATRTQIKAGATCIKIVASGGVLTKGVTPDQTTFSQDEIRIVVEEAHHAGLRVTAHAIGRQGILDSVVAGVDTIEHGFYLDEPIAEMMVEKGTFLVPTLSGLYSALASTESKSNLSPWLLERCEQIIVEQKRSFRLALAAGVPIAGGTDAGTAFNHHGSIAKEAWLLHEYGADAARAVRAVTVDAAENLGLSHDRGRIWPGMRADLVAVAGNPLEDIRALERVMWVIKDGVVIESSD